MGTKAKRAKELFKDGYNCSQAVLGAFCEDLNLDFESAMRMASSFGGGMGRLREVCGAVSGLFLAVGLKFGYSSPIDIDAKAKHYKLIQQLAEKFKEKNGSIICRELLNIGENKESHIPEQRTETYYKKRPCAELVEDAAEIFEELLALEK